MKEYIGFVRTDAINSTIEVEFEVEDNVYGEELEQIAKDEIFQFVEWGYAPKKEDIKDK